MTEAEKGRSRRPHRKTRTGCVKCKQRKIKCDEQKPTCKNCVAHEEKCSFLSTHPRSYEHLTAPLPSPNSSTTTSSGPRSRTFAQLPAPAISIPTQLQTPYYSNSALTFTMLDLRILHFTSTNAFALFDFPSGANHFQTSILQIAFSHPFLMHELLSLSALHLSIIHKSDQSISKIYASASVAHLAKALSLFIPAIANLGKENCDACLAFSMTMFVHAWAAQDPSRPSTLFFASDEPPSAVAEPSMHTAQWAKLAFGTSTIFQYLRPSPETGCFTPLLKIWEGIDQNQNHPLNPAEKEALDYLSEAWNGAGSSSTLFERQNLDSALKKLCWIYSIIDPANGLKPSRVSIVLSWFQMISQEYLKMLERRQPEALLLVLYYCVCLKQLNHVWWMVGKAENLLITVTNILDRDRGGKWERWMRWPIERVIG